MTTTDRQPLRYLSLFSGVGGFDLGFDRAGMVCAGQVEIDEYCRRVLAKHWPDVKRMNDVREVQGDEFGTIDIICGGFPCQPHSLAGKRRGAADDRNLWPEYRRLVDVIRPRWVVGENVPGIRTTILDAVLSDLEDLNYTWGTLIIPACAFGAWHVRERVFIVAHSNEHNEHGRSGALQMGRQQIAGAAAAASNTGRTQWLSEPGVGRVVYGVPNRVDRLGALGNAVVPQVAEWLGRRIVEVDRK